MTEQNFYILVYAWIAAALVIFPFVLKIAAPYGRHTTQKWGMLIGNKAGWIIMESASLVVFALFFLFGSIRHNPVTWIFFGLYTLHYINRTFIFPLRTRTTGKKMSLSVVFMALGFNFMNGFLNGYYLGSVATWYTLSWLSDPRFIFGILLFFCGMGINMWADNRLIHLRKPGETGYVIPTGGLFRFISCPNHFGEIIEWTGWALMTWSAPGLSFAVWTFANLMPRALHHHKWYKKTFINYPEERKAVFPYIL